MSTAFECDDNKRGLDREDVPRKVTTAALEEPEAESAVESSSPGYRDSAPMKDRAIPRSWWKWPLQPLVDLGLWLHALRAAFGAPFVAVVMTAYGINQGYSQSVGDMAINYYWKDVQKLDPASSQAYNALAAIPWDLKPIYGLITDSFPVGGYQRWPYLAIMGGLGVLCWAALGTLPRVKPVVAALLLLGVSLSTAFPDVVVDALVAQQSRINPFFAGDLQSLTWGTYAGGGLVGYAISGPLVHNLGPRGGFCILALATGLFIAVAVMLPEARLPPNKRKPQLRALATSTALFVKTIKHPTIWKPALYLYLANGAICPDISEAFFYWYTDGKEGPGFSEGFMGVFYATGYVGMLIGVAIYNRWFRQCEYRKIFFWAQILVVGAGLLDLVLVLRLNLALGIPDYMFVVGDKAVSHAIMRLQVMPMMVLATQLCPPGIEGTLYAFLMSVWNFGRHTGAWEGAALMRLTGIRRGQYSNLGLAVAIRTALRILPTLLLFLVPPGCPGQHLPVLAPQQDSAMPDGEQLVTQEKKHMHGTEDKLAAGEAESWQRAEDWGAKGRDVRREEAPLLTKAGP